MAKVNSVTLAIVTKFYKSFIRFSTGRIFSREVVFFNLSFSASSLNFKILFVVAYGNTGNRSELRGKILNAAVPHHIGDFA